MEARSAHVASNITDRRFVYCSKVHQVETCRVVVVELKKQIHDGAEENQTEDDENDEHCSRSRDQRSLQYCSQDALYAILLLDEDESESICDIIRSASCV